MSNQGAILLFQCRDRIGILSQVTGAIFLQGGNITTLDQYSTDPEGGYFFLRLEFTYELEKTNLEQMRALFTPIAASFGANWEIHDKGRRMRMGILVSKADHCLFELLYRWKAGELFLDIPCIVGNSPLHADLSLQYEIPYFYFPTTAQDKKEEAILDVVQESTDFLVLARYMQILSHDFLLRYRRDVINIHHSFLPSFAGARPYHQAYERGVKLIGATAHYVTEALDEGPIIEQMVTDVSHRDSVESMVTKGKNLEKLTLSAAVHAHLNHQVMRHGNKTIVFKS